MSTIQDVTPEELAKLIFHYREALMHDAETDAGPAHSWDDASQDNRKLMVAPAASPFTTLSFSVFPVSTMMYVYPRFGSERIRSHSSSPEKSGIIQSVTTIDGACFRNSS